MFYWDSVAKLGCMVKTVTNGRISYSCFKGGLGITGGVVGVIPGNHCKCPECRVELNPPVDRSYSKQYDGSYLGGYCTRRN